MCSYGRVGGHVKHTHGTQCSHSRRGGKPEVGAAAEEQHLCGLRVGRFKAEKGDGLKRIMLDYIKLQVRASTSHPCLPRPPPARPHLPPAHLVPFWCRDEALLKILTWQWLCLAACSSSACLVD